MISPSKEARATRLSKLPKGAKNKKGEKMIAIERIDEGTSLITVSLPEGRTQEQLIEELHQFLNNMAGGDLQKLYGTHCRINGRVTTAMSLYLGHYLAHITKSVSIFDPKEGSYVRSVWH